MKRFLLFLVCLGLVPLSCEKQSSEDDYKVFKSCHVETSVIAPTGAFKDTITAVDSVYLAFHPEFHYVAQHINLSLTSSLYADEPPQKGHMGLKYEVDSIGFVASKEYNGIQAGKDISRHFYAYKQVKVNGAWIWTKTDIGFLVEYLNRTGGFVPITFKTLPEENGAYIFTFSIYSSNGGLVKATTEELIFE